MLVSFLLAITIGLVLGIISIGLSITFSQTIFIVLSSILFLFLGYFLAYLILNWKELSKASSEIKKEHKAARQQKKIDEDENQRLNDQKFLSELLDLAYSKKLFPFLNFGYGVDLIHQNPGTTETFTVIQDIGIPKVQPDTPQWNEIKAKYNEEMDDFIYKNKDQLVLEDMKIDVKA